MGTINRVPLTRAVSKDTQSVAFAANVFTVMTSSTTTVEINTSGAISVIAVHPTASNSTTSITKHWKTIFNVTISFVSTLNAWKKSSWSLSHRWI